MRSKLLVNISAGLLQVHLARARVLRQPVVKTLYAALMGSVAYDFIDTESVQGLVDVQDIAAGLAQACAKLQRRHARDFQGPSVNVELGAAYARVAVIDVPTLPPKQWDAHIQTWMAWNWGQESTLGMLSHTSLGQDKLLLANVKRELFDALCRFCESRRYKFSVCQPAAAGIVQRLVKTSGGDDFGVTAICEGHGGHQASVVQFISVFEGGVQSVHRMCLPADSEDALDTMAHRLRARHRKNVPITLSTIAWPPSTPGQGLHG